MFLNHNIGNLRKEKHGDTAKGRETKIEKWTAKQRNKKGGRKGGYFSRIINFTKVSDQKDNTQNSLSSTPLK